MVVCPAGKAVVAYAKGGGGQDINDSNGSHVNFGISCADMPQGDTSLGKQRYVMTSEKWGQIIACNADEVITGICSSGADQNCLPGLGLGGGDGEKVQAVIQCTQTKGVDVVGQLATPGAWIADSTTTNQGSPDKYNDWSVLKSKTNCGITTAENAGSIAACNGTDTNLMFMQAICTNGRHTDNCNEANPNFGFPMNSSHVFGGCVQVNDGGGPYYKCTTDGDCVPDMAPDASDYPGDSTCARSCSLKPPPDALFYTCSATGCVQVSAKSGGRNYQNDSTCDNQCIPAPTYYSCNASGDCEPDTSGANKNKNDKYCGDTCSNPSSKNFYYKCNTSGECERDTTGGEEYKNDSTCGNVCGGSSSPSTKSLPTWLLPVVIAVVVLLCIAILYFKLHSRTPHDPDAAQQTASIGAL